VVSGQPPDSVDSRASSNAELYLVDVAGGPPKRFPTGTVNASNPFWSADGHWIYFNTERLDAIWKAAVEGGAAIRLTGEGRGFPQESVAGTRLYFYRNEDGVERLGPHPSTAATNGPSREWLRTYNGYPRGAAFTSALRGTFPLGTSTLLRGRSTRSRTCLVCSSAGRPASRPTVILFFSAGSSTQSRTSSSWRGSGRSRWPDHTAGQ
jgi:hypothetical protein